MIGSIIMGDDLEANDRLRAANLAAFVAALGEQAAIRAKLRLLTIERIALNERRNSIHAMQGNRLACEHVCAMIERDRLLLERI